MKNARRELLKLACGTLAGAGLGLHRAAAWAQKPQFRDAGRTRDKIVALVRSFGSDDPKAMRHIQRIEPIAEISIPGVKVAPDQLPLMDYFVADLHLRYSFDDPRFVSSVSAADLKRLGLADHSVRGNVDILKSLAVDVYAGAGKEALSKTVFLWNQGRWEAFA